MTEKEKMLAGELFYSPDEQLKEERLRAKELLYDYNHLRPDETDKKETLMKKLLGSIGQEFSIGQPFYCDYGYNIHIGSHFYANTDVITVVTIKWLSNGKFLSDRTQQFFHQGFFFIRFIGTQMIVVV